MAPFIQAWPASELEVRASVNSDQRTRKKFDGDLKSCDLFEMLQYNCKVEEPKSKDSVVKCKPVERIFRRCKDAKGIFTVETTAWEGVQFGDR